MTTVAAGLALLVGLSGPTGLPLTGIPGATTDLRASLDPARGIERPADALALARDLNARRSANGLGRLVLDPGLCDVARRHALDMVARRYFGHDTPDGRTPFDRMRNAGIRYGYAGENLALDLDEGAASQALWHSNEHRENILEPHYAKVGVAAVAAGDDGEIFVEEFSD